MNVEVSPEQRIGSSVAERGGERAPEAFKPEQLPHAQEWLDMTRGQLARPEAAEWKEGEFSYRRPFMKGYLQVSPSHKYLVLDNSELKRSFIITDGPVVGGDYRYVTIFSTDLPDQEGEYLKRHAGIDLIYDNAGKLIAVSGGDSKNSNNGDPVGFKADGWYAGYTIAGRPSLDDKNDLTLQQTKDLMEELLPQIAQAKASREGSKRIRYYRSRMDEIVDAIFAIEEAKQWGSEKEVEKGVRRLERVRNKFFKDFNICF